MRTSESVKNINEHLSKAQAQIETPKKSKTANTGTYSYTYADLDTIFDSIRDVFERLGLAVVQEAVSEDGRCGVTTRITHESGEWIEGGPLYLPAGNTPQTFGSAITYARRYALTAMLGIATEEDDDAGSAQRSQRSKNSAAKRKPEPEKVEIDPLKVKRGELVQAVKDAGLENEKVSSLLAEWFGEGKTSKDLDIAQLDTAILGVKREGSKVPAQVAHEESMKEKA